MPAISPTTPAEISYAITGSKAFVANALLDFNNFPRRFFVSYPDAAAAGLTLRLVRRTGPGGAVDLAAAPDDIVNSTDIPGRDVFVQRGSAAGVTTLTCNIQDPSEAGVLDEHYEVQVASTAARDWTFAVDNALNSNVVQLVSDPVAAFFGLAGNLLEKNGLTLTAQAASGPAGVTVVRNGPVATGLGLPNPAPTYAFGHAGPLAIIGLPAPASASQTYTLQNAVGDPVPLPGVYGNTVVPFTVDTVYPGIGGPAFLTGHGEQEATVKPRPQRVQLILDRSGSMGGTRWENAKTAARIFINFFGEFRAAVNDDDRIGVSVFSDPNPVFRATDPAGPPDITDVVPLGKPADVAGGDLGPAVFGLPGGSTPIGDGLFFGLRKLQDAGLPADLRTTVVLLTDGEENCGTITIGPVGVNGARTWAVAKGDPAISQIAGSADTHLYTIGLGDEPNHQILEDLVPAGQFAAALDVGTLIDFYAGMFTISQEANKLDTRQQRVPADPVSTTEVFFETTSAQRFGVAVLKEPGAAPADVIDAVEISRWDGATFQVEKVVPQDYEGHIYLGVGDAGAFNGGTATWRIRRFNGANVKPIGLTDVFAFEDLHVKSVVALDKKRYLTGDPMRLAVEIRNDGEPVRGATVRAVLDAPADGVGGLIAALDPDDLARQQRAGGRDDDKHRDRPWGRGALIDAILRKYDWKNLPRCNPDPGGLFVDGTDLLHDHDGDGIYTNTFARVNADGVYNWTIFASGEDPGKNPFSHRLDRSTLATIGVSARETIVRRESVKPPSGQRLSAMKVTVTPRDRFKNLLGPGFDDTVIFAVSEGGVFEHVAERQDPPVNTDGTYTRTVLIQRGARPTLRVSVNGVILPKIYLTYDRD